MTLHPVILPIPQDTPPRSERRVRQQRMCARLALQRCAGECRAPVDGWEKDIEGVPLPKEGFCWSVSHKRQWVAEVIAETPVGIDIEQIVPRRRELHDALADRAEWTIMGDRSWDSFFRLWTAKEAALKANGAGIGGFRTCCLVEVCDERHMMLHYEGQPWRIEHFYHAGHVAAVTCDLNQVNWCVLDQSPKYVVWSP